DAASPDDFDTLVEERGLARRFGVLVLLHLPADDDASQGEIVEIVRLGHLRARARAREAIGLRNGHFFADVVSLDERRVVATRLVDVARRRQACTRFLDALDPFAAGDRIIADPREFADRRSIRKNDVRVHVVSDAKAFVVDVDLQIAIGLDGARYRARLLDRSSRALNALVLWRRLLRGERDSGRGA